MSSLLPQHAQGLDIPEELKALYKTVWELRQRTLVEMAADRGAFIDQSQSFNVHMSDPNFGKLTSLHFHAWKVRTAVSSVLTQLCCNLRLQVPSVSPPAQAPVFVIVQLGLKTGMYYLRTRAAADAIKFTVDQQALARNKAARVSKTTATGAGLADTVPLKVCHPRQISACLVPIVHVRYQSCTLAGEFVKAIMI